MSNYGYSIFEPSSYPVVIFAHSCLTSEYKYTRNRGMKHFEISFFEQGQITRTYPDGRELIFPEGCVTVTVPGDEFNQTCDGRHRHITVGFVCEGEISEKSIETCSDNKLMTALPVVLFQGDDTEKIRSLISKLVFDYDLNNGRLKLISDIFAVLSTLNEAVLHTVNSGKAGEYSAGNFVYCKKAKRYIAENICNPITVSDIASYLGITPRYLGEIYNEVTGQKLITYINEVKLKKVVEIASSTGLSFSAAGEAVGFTDVHYLSRIFKKFYGVTYTEYITRKNIKL